MDNLDISVLKFLADTKNNKKKISEISVGIQPYNDASVLYESLNSMAKEDSDYVRKFIKNNSTIVYQKDIIIDDKEKFMYNEERYNNDSQYFDFIKDRVLVTCDDYVIYSKDFDFYVDLYINGVRVSNTKYLNLPSYNKYNFITGTRRFFIYEDLVKTEDTVSIVARKEPKMEKYYTVINVSSNNNSYKFNKNEIGTYFGMYENLCLYKLVANVNWVLVPKSDYSILENLDNENELILKVNTSLEDTEKLYLINKLKHQEIIWINSTDYSNEEYLELPSMVLRLDTKNNIPLPIEDINEIEIFLDGFKLINNIDFILAKDTNGVFYIQFTGILKINSEVVVRNKCFSNEYAFYKKIDKMPDIYDDYEGYDYRISTGINDLREFNIPIGIDYVEAYLGRRRIPISKKRAIINRFLKIDDQHHTFNNLELYSDFFFTSYMEQLLNNRENDKVIYSQLHDISADWVKDAWLYNYEDSGEVDEDGNPIYYQHENNELLPNDDQLGNNEASDVFLDSIYKIELLAAPSSVTEGKMPKFTVLGYYNDETNTIDITDYCSFTEFDPYKIGEQEVTASFNQGSRVLTDTIKIQVLYKEIAELVIESNSNFFVVGDPLRSNVRVVAIFEDNTRREIPLSELDSYDIPEYAGIPDPTTGKLEAGGMYLKAQYSYNNNTKKVEKAILVAESEDRKIKSVELVTVNNTKEDNKYDYSSLRIFVTYTNRIVQEFNNEAVDMYLTDIDKNITSDVMNPGHFVLSINQTYKIALKFFTDNSKSAMIPVVINNEDSEYYYGEIRISQNTLTSINRILLYDSEQLLTIYNRFIIKPEYVYWRVKDIGTNNFITVGKNKVNDSALALIPLNIGDLVLVEFLDADENVVDQLIFIIHSTDKYRETISGAIHGNLLDGYTIEVSKLDLETLLTELAENDLRIINEEGIIIAKLNFDKNNPSTPNLAKGYADTLTEDSQNIYCNFRDFSTDDGNIQSIYNHQNEKLYLDITSFTKLVELTININEPEIKTVTDYTSKYIVSTIDTKCLVVTPVFEGVSGGIVITKVESTRPKYQNKLTDSDEVLAMELNNYKSLLFNINNNGTVLLNSQRKGVNKYYYYINNSIYLLEVVIKEDVVNGIMLIDSIAGKHFDPNESNGG